MKTFNASSAPKPDGIYAQACLAEGVNSLLFVSGQIPIDAAGEIPADFSSQARLVWRNILAQLNAAGMDVADIAKVTTFLSDRAFREQNSEIRQEVLEGHTPALTVIICDIYDERWLLEIEVFATK